MALARPLGLAGGPRRVGGEAFRYSIVAILVTSCSVSPLTAVPGGSRLRMQRLVGLPCGAQSIKIGSAGFDFAPVVVEVEAVGREVDQSLKK